MRSSRHSRRRGALLLALAVLTTSFGAGFAGARPAQGAGFSVAATSSGLSTSRQSITLNRPAGTSPGHVMIASIVSNDSEPGFTAAARPRPGPASPSTGPRRRSRASS